MKDTGAHGADRADEVAGADQPRQRLDLAEDVPGDLLADHTARLIAGTGFSPGDLLALARDSGPAADSADEADDAMNGAMSAAVQEAFIAGWAASTGGSLAADSQQVALDLHPAKHPGEQPSDVEDQS